MKYDLQGPFRAVLIGITGHYTSVFMYEEVVMRPTRLAGMGRTGYVDQCFLFVVWAEFFNRMSGAGEYIGTGTSLQWASNCQQPPLVPSIYPPPPPPPPAPTKKGL